MSFEPKTQAFNSSISSVTIGTGDKAVTLGGINVLPFYAFDAPITNAPKIGVEITDHGMAAYPQAGLQEFYAGCQTVADMAKRVETMHGASFICLHFEGADPNGDNRSVEECVEIAKSVADATDLPLVIMGCKNIEKDAELFTKVSEALQGKNILVFSAREENYKSVGASAVMAYGQKVGAESAVDINLAKQLNVLMTQLGVAPTSIVMQRATAMSTLPLPSTASVRLPSPRAIRSSRCPSSRPSPPRPGPSRNPWSARPICPNGAAPRSAALRWRSPRLPPASPAAPMPSSCVIPRPSRPSAR